MGTPVILEMRNIRKSFPGVLANDDINLKVYAGEIHALLGENGAGKSTSMNILTGLYQEDAGEILIRGQRVSIKTPLQAIKLGIAMVHQHFRLVQTFTTAENITLGLSSPKLFLGMAKVEAEVNRISKEYGLPIDPGAKIWQLSVGEQQRVEIIKMLYRGVDILIMDEPTAVLTPQEVEELFVTLRKMADIGKSIVFITHKLDEVMQIADRITVFRKGRNVATLNKEKTNKRELATLMVGSEMPAPAQRSAGPGERVILSVERVSAYGDRNRQALIDIGFNIKEGSIFGIAGVAGNGQRELAEVIVGLRVIKSGRIKVNGTDITNMTPLEIIDKGVSFIPEERMGTGLAPNLSLIENAILKSYRKKPVCNGIFLNKGQMVKQTEAFVQRFDIKTAAINVPVRLLSGGNAQRLLLARETSANPKVIIACHPTRGLDIGATEAVRKILIKQSEAGTAVLLISEDLDELMALCNEIAVMYEGRIMGIIPARRFNREDIGLLMTGSDYEQREVTSCD